MVYYREGLAEPELGKVVALVRGTVQRTNGGDGKTARNLKVPRYVGLHFLMI